MKKPLIPSKLKLTAVIAEREYQLVTRKGKKRKVVARFGKPRRLPARAGWYCVYQIEGLEEPTKPGFSPGLDSVQAIFVAMQLAWTELVSSQAYREGRLSFWGIQNLGLPPIHVSYTEPTPNHRTKRRPKGTRGPNQPGRSNSFLALSASRRTQQPSR